MKQNDELNPEKTLFLGSFKKNLKFFEKFCKMGLSNRNMAPIYKVSKTMHPVKGLTGKYKEVLLW